MSEAIILIGGSGHARVIIDCIYASGGVVAGILDDGMTAGEEVLGVPVLGKTDDFEKFREYQFLIAIGNNPVRRRIAESMQVRWTTAIHPSAVISPYAKLGEGTVVMANAVVNPGATVGRHCIVNTGAIVEHDCILEDYVHISPAAALGGAVKVGEQTHIGIGARVRNNVSICKNCTIGAGAVVVSDIPTPGVYVGVPARKIK